ncbi:hypothetical protein NQ315_014776 [Exocentrus adspersus]|uniref:Reverse transcriptase domain-containing protein n=1 Tax=Exocentrus adspersus TaxID=1586481 RepID=A0AAV8VM05_9CUCU|nr:hypothetical protein NQ315_014776 [Exocentrus adspersus]
MLRSGFLGCKWGPTQELAVQYLKEELQSATPQPIIYPNHGVYHPNHNFPWHVATDASHIGISGQLFQVVGGCKKWLFNTLKQNLKPRGLRLKTTIQSEKANRIISRAEKSLNDFYQQDFGMAMGSSLSPIMSNIFMEMEHFEETYVQSYVNKPKIWWRYVDDVVYSQIMSFQLKSWRSYIDFTVEGVEGTMCYRIDYCRHKSTDGTWPYRNTPLLLSTFQIVPTAKDDLLAMDVLGLLVRSWGGVAYIFVVLNGFTKYVTLYPFHVTAAVFLDVSRPFDRSTRTS